MQIDLTPDEWETVMSALSYYGHHWIEMGVLISNEVKRDGKPFFPSEIQEAHDMGDKAFSLLHKVHDNLLDQSPEDE